jgi:hypothetical protein
MAVRIKEQLGVTKTVMVMTWDVIRKYPVILVPFLITAVFKFLALLIAYWSPRMPFYGIIAPLVIRGGGTKLGNLFGFAAFARDPANPFYLNPGYFHYPGNFEMLPAIYDFGQRWLIYLTVDAIMAGLAVGLIYAIHSGSSAEITSNLRNAARRYPTLLVLWFLLLVMSIVLFRGPGWLLVRTGVHVTVGTANLITTVAIVIGVLLDAFFAFLTPAVITESTRTWHAIGRSFSVARKVFLPTLVIVAIPTLIQIGVMFLRGQGHVLMIKTVPEIILWVIGIEIAISLMANVFLTAGTTTIFLLNKDMEKGV